MIYSLGPVVSGFFVDKFGLITGMRTGLLGIIIALPALLLFNRLVDISKPEAS